MLDIIRPDQIIAILALLGLLVAVWLIVRSNRGALTQRLTGDRRLRVTEVAMLGHSDRAILLSVDDREFLVVHAKGTAPMISALGPRPDLPEAAK